MPHKQPRCKKCKKKMGMLDIDYCYRCIDAPKGKWEITKTEFI